jgi:hypothetical protein
VARRLERQVEALQRDRAPYLADMFVGVLVVTFVPWR